MNPTLTSRPLLALGFSLFLAACGTSLPADTQVQTETGRHITSDEAGSSAAARNDIPAIISNLPLVPEPGPQQAPELYSVVALDVPVRELLFAVARDASINIDIHPGVSGRVSLNAIDQTIPQILERLSQQIDIRWSFDNNQRLLIEPDSPFWRIYRIDYVNVSREANTSADVSTSIVNVGGGGGTGGNNSSVNITQSSNNNFWNSLRANLVALLTDLGGDNSTQAENSVVANPESGIINIRASSRQHAELRTFIDFIHARSLSQVLIEATVVEVNLNDRYQAGVDWAALSRNSGRLNIVQANTGTNIPSGPGAQGSFLTITSNEGLDDGVTATVSLLSQFGDLRVLSSPRIMALNNQAAMLRVVENRVYFTIDVQPAILNATGGIQTPATYSSNVETVPVGFVMTVTPQISDDNQVTLNVRPTISRIVRFVNDPNPELRQASVPNLIPEIQIREIESILKVNSGQIAVLGGLMQDTIDNNTTGLPVLSRMPGIGNLFSYRDDSSIKTELIVFIRPVVINQPSLTGDLDRFANYLPDAGLTGNAR